jgi:hypothetical protein
MLTLIFVLFAELTIVRANGLGERSRRPPYRPGAPYAPSRAGQAMLPNPTRPERAGNPLSLTRTQPWLVFHLATQRRRSRVSPAP